MTCHVICEEYHVFWVPLLISYHLLPLLQKMELPAMLGTLLCLQPTAISVTENKLLLALSCQCPLIKSFYGQLVY